MEWGWEEMFMEMGMKLCGEAVMVRMGMKFVWMGGDMVIVFATVINGFGLDLDNNVDRSQKLSPYPRPIGF